MGKGLEINRLKAEKNAKGLELRATLAETILREALIEFGFDFEFQKPLYTKNTCYIADFFFPEMGLVVELDGSAHNGREKQDARRTANIKKYHKYKVIRFKNAAVFADVIRVVNLIQDWQRLKPLPASEKKPKLPKPQAKVVEIVKPKAKSKNKGKKQKVAQYWIAPYNSAMERGERMKRNKARAARLAK